MSEKHEINTKAFYNDFIIGGAVAGISKTGAAPLERIKLLLQNQGEMIKQGHLSLPYGGAINCFQRIVRDEGFGSLWRGNLVNVLRYIPTQALGISFKEQIKLFFDVDTKKSDNYTKWFVSNIGAGGLAGALSLSVVYPLDYARTRLANDVTDSLRTKLNDTITDHLPNTKKTEKMSLNKKRQFDGVFDLYRKTIKADGFIGLYRGFLVSCVCVVVYRGCYFGFYDSLKPLILNGNLKDNFFAAFILGWGVSIGAGLISYPLDTIRRRMMMTSTANEKYKSSLDCLKKVMVNEGFKSLFKGSGTNVLRGIVGAGVLAGFDKIKCHINSV